MHYYDGCYWSYDAGSFVGDCIAHLLRKQLGLKRAYNKPVARRFPPFKASPDWKTGEITDA
jgi:hypothetical protein